MYIGLELLPTGGFTWLLWFSYDLLSCFYMVLPSFYTKHSMTEGEVVEAGTCLVTGTCQSRNVLFTISTKSSSSSSSSSSSTEYFEMLIIHQTFRLFSLNSFVLLLYLSIFPVHVSSFFHCFHLSFNFILFNVLMFTFPRNFHSISPSASFPLIISIIIVRHGYYGFPQPLYVVLAGPCIFNILVSRVNEFAFEAEDM